MLKSREDLTMILGPHLVGGGRYPRIERCALCGGGSDGVSDEIVHEPACVLASAKVTHVRMTGCRARARGGSNG